ncbi:MAG: bifunctional hydroxymethylpyrimidine kinase/phosphomethylpyrimidine kinase [Synechococcales cyanobacterium]
MALTPPIALTIAGSDSGGGAGIQADLRTFAFHRVHGTSALTCVTAQNTLGVTRVDALPGEAVTAQITAVVEDLGVQASKTGMLLNADIMNAVANAIEQQGLAPLVVDPVMVSRTGAVLLDPEAMTTLKQRVIPLATLITPNRWEAQILAQQEIHTLGDMREAALVIARLGCASVLIKGGSLPGESRGTDGWWDGQEWHLFPQTAIDTPHTHGTGCTLSAAITARLALGEDLAGAIQSAKHYVTAAIAHALAIGHGQGPIGHFYPLLT